MITGLIGKKVDQTQKFLEDGTRVPVTVVAVGNLSVVAIKTAAKNGYTAVQLGWGQKKKSTKPLIGHVKGAKLDKAPRFLREIRLKNQDTEDGLPTVGDTIKASDVLKPGDVVDVTGTSKGKGYAGVVKRHNFKGGPRTHGQSDRERAPGSIGQTTTPGRVYRGKRMSGRMGQDRVTLKNLKVIDVLDSEILIKGLVPGIKDSLLIVTKVGEDKKFVPILKKAVDMPQEAPAEAPKQATSQEAPQEEQQQTEETPKEEQNASK